MAGYSASGDDGWGPREFTAYLSTKYIPSQDKPIADEPPADDCLSLRLRAFRTIVPSIQGDAEQRGLVVQPVAQ